MLSDKATPIERWLTHLTVFMSLMFSSMYETSENAQITSV